MKKKITIAIDAMGGDNSPDKTIHGLKLFLDLNSKEDDFIINLFGDKDKIDNALLRYKISQNKIKIFHTSSVISDEETP